MPEAARLLQFPTEPDHGPTVVQVVARYLLAKKLDRQAGAFEPSSFARAKHYLKSFARLWGKVPVSRCRNDELKIWLVRNPQWISPHTRNDAIGSVVTCFRWAEVNDELDGSSPFKKPKGFVGVLAPRQAITEEEYRLLMRVARECNGKTRRARPSRTAFRLLLYFLHETASRTCEGREALWTDLDWNRGLIVLYQHKTARKTGRGRLIPLRAPLLRILRWVYARRPTGTCHIFLTSRKGHWTRDRLCKAFREFAAIAGVRKEVSSYCLRHAFVVAGLEAGLGARQLADVLGHVSTRQIDWYGQTTRTHADYLRSVADQVRGKPKH